MNLSVVYDYIKKSLLNISKLLGDKNYLSFKVKLAAPPEIFPQRFFAAIVAVSRKSDDALIFTYNMWICKNSDGAFHIKTLGVEPNNFQEPDDEKLSKSWNKPKPALTKFDIVGHLTSEQITADFIMRFHLTCPQYGNMEKKVTTKMEGFVGKMIHYHQLKDQYSISQN